MTNLDIWRVAFDSAPTRDADFRTLAEIPFEPVDGPEEGEFPCAYPYTRGIHASMYRSKF